jgi:hypothetical protein
MWKAVFSNTLLGLETSVPQSGHLATSSTPVSASYGKLRYFYDEKSIIDFVRDSKIQQTFGTINPELKSNFGCKKPTHES